MRKINKSIVLVISTLLIALLFSGCISLTPPDNGSVHPNDAPLTAEAVYAMAKEEGYSGTLEEFIAEFKGEKGADGVGIEDVRFNSEAHLIMTLTNGKSIDCGKITVNVQAATISIGENGNWYINGEDAGYRAVGENGAGWLSGTVAPPVNAGRDGDFYFDSTAANVYKKESGEWMLIASLKSEGSGDTVINEGDNYDIDINLGSSSEKYAAAKALLSAVSVESNFKKTVYGTTRSYASSGAGVIYTLDKSAGDAYIITNHHVVYDLNSITSDKISDDIGIYLYGMEYSDFRIPAKYVGGSLNYDIAVLKVSGSDILRESAAMAAEIADSDTVRVLDTAIAIGNPAGNGISATLGSVSVESQNINNVAVDGVTNVTYRVMRIDTPINRGNSGGGLFDERGRLIAIVNAKDGDSTIENMGYAIPSNVAVSVANNIIATCDGETYKEMKRCDVGVTVSVIDASAEYDTQTGTVIRKEVCAVSAVESLSPLKDRLHAGDIITGIKIGNVSYGIDYSYDLEEALINARVGDEITVYVLREGTETEVTVTVLEEQFSRIS